jgi:hypothetical protein
LRAITIDGSFLRKGPMHDLLLLLFSLAGVSALAAIVDSFERS